MSSTNYLLHKFSQIALSFVFLFILGNSTFAQTKSENSPPQINVTTQMAAMKDEKAEEIVRRAIAAQGGDAFLGVRTIIGRGYYTPFDKGISTLPQAFIDYLVFPDRERTEFRSARGRNIQTNVGDGGWMFESATRSLVDMNREGVENFRLAMRTSTDNLLRGWWRKEGATLSYLGRREAGLAKRNEAVRLTYADGLTIDFEFGAKDGLPAKTVYRRKNDAGEELTEEDRFASYKTFAGVTVPFIIDHYRAGEQSSRINYDSIEFNSPIPDTLFTKPVNIKAIK